MEKTTSASFKIVVLGEGKQALDSRQPLRIDSST